MDRDKVVSLRKRLGGDDYRPIADLLGVTVACFKDWENGYGPIIEYFTKKLLGLSRITNAFPEDASAEQILKFLRNYYPSIGGRPMDLMGTDREYLIFEKVWDVV